MRAWLAFAWTPTRTLFDDVLGAHVGATGVILSALEKHPQTRFDRLQLRSLFSIAKFAFLQWFSQVLSNLSGGMRITHANSIMLSQDKRSSGGSGAGKSAGAGGLAAAGGGVQQQQQVALVEKLIVNRSGGELQQLQAVPSSSASGTATQATGGTSFSSSSSSSNKAAMHSNGYHRSFGELGAATLNTNVRLQLCRVPSAGPRPECRVALSKASVVGFRCGLDLPIVAVVRSLSPVLQAGVW
ncbi:hypothetical protein BIW11_08971 [Tropilaelaps mercedesae]|uniref:Uncharacterized protein n=1 Tax=Tropilaelaps mercedesae TaxID=418985 RepID=A0A1V9XM62_9ACAR|nr:hypothetical protein BIW11_08971 [Tropilaelaps mercedesae]